ncbi:tRNA (N6-isopentenyl adenosine(37)-C2)-methylthiotransferase MiaB [Ruminococcaceae bacterium OttesenSCG-928-I18]|nr:tRNA (N6-isopentenyl adenosine(37)-C2)-methylthiotransferase MiaB [Ruminococcaceae bacterium OttesenSCG-928-I18]
MEYQKNEQAAAVLASHYKRQPVAYVRSFGCQQSVNDGEKLKGVLLDVGFSITEEPGKADLILFNTCAVREHAEQRVYGNLGALKGLKQQKPGLLIGICGCMAEEKCTVEKLRASYPYVDLVLGTNVADILPDILADKLTSRKKALRLPPVREEIVEYVPQTRESSFKAFLPIMHGCDNACSYCIVPLVRGSERSRASKDIKREFEELVQQGYKEITLVGQNVNSYGKGLEEEIDFSDLLSLLCETPGEYQVRFMTSHPKDATRKMVDTIAKNEHLCKHLHLPVQSGSNDILARMNRKYTAEDYLALIRYAKEVCPEMTFSSDIMVGFPGESEEDFEHTLALVREVRFTQLFTFIYSKRPGTEAAELADDTPHKTKSDRIAKLLALQEEVVGEMSQNWIGNTYPALVEGPGREEGHLVGRLDNNMLVEFEADPSLMGSFLPLHIEEVKGAVLIGSVAK